MNNNKEIPRIRDFIHIIEEKYGFNAHETPHLFATKCAAEFARLHVEAAINAIIELKEINGTEGIKIYKEQILNAYSVKDVK